MQQGNRRQAREHAMQMLYQIRVSKQETPEAIEQFRNHFITNLDAQTYAESLVTQVESCRSQIDALISEAARHWSLDRIGLVEKCVLQIAITELVGKDPLPENIVINEAIEICKKYGSDESAKFVHGVLDAIANRAEPMEGVA